SNVFQFSVKNPAPIITSVTPSEAAIGGGNVVVTIAGSGFVSSSEVYFGDTVVSKTALTYNSITATVPGTLLQTLGQYQVKVKNPAPGGGDSNTVSFSVKNPIPAITSVTPSEAAIGSGDVVVTIAGSGFVSSSEVYFGDTVVSKTAFTYNSITATIPGTLLQTAGLYQVTVKNPAPGGGDSNAIAFSVKNPAPAITSVTPSEAAVGSGSVIVTISGSGFLSTSEVYFGTTVVSKTALTSTFITVTIPGTLFQMAGLYQVKVKNPTPGGGDSNAIAFSVKNPAPAITSVTPLEASVGSGDVVVAIAGSGFVSASEVYFGDTVVSKTAFTYNSITATIPGTLLQTAGQYQVTVKNPAPGGGDSNTIAFSVKNPAPAITSVTPSEAGVGVGDVVVAIAGSGFVSTSEVYFGDTVVSKTAVTSSSITVMVPSALLQTAGQYQVKVKNPAPGGGDSAPYTFRVVAELSISITEPSDGATVDKVMTLVRGTFSWESGDVGIVVNGVAAEVSGRQWYANNVRLAVGANTITATITDVSGNSKVRSINVNTTTIDNIVVLSANITSGLAPLTTKFNVIKNLPNEVTGYAIDFEGDGNIDYTAAKFRDVSYTYTPPGVYYPTVTVTDSAGNTYTDRIVVTVLDETETDAMLRAKWNNMKAAFVSGDIEGGLQYICAGSRDDYRNALQFLDDMVPATFSSMQEISLLYVRNGVASYRIRQNEVIESSSVEITYYIYFKRDTDGIIRIDRF
ncbi:MAG: IPT/TIG domain-containing protein, partial [Candidatus Magnetobacterium sp. LHC-1]